MVEATRYLGLIIARGTAVTIIGPEAGLCAIANPFLDDAEEKGDDAAAAAAAAGGPAAARPQGSA